MCITHTYLGICAYVITCTQKLNKFNFTCICLQVYTHVCCSCFSSQSNPIVHQMLINQQKSQKTIICQKLLNPAKDAKSDHICENLISLICHQPNKCHTTQPNQQTSCIVAATTIRSLSPCIDSIPWGYSISLADAPISKIGHLWDHYISLQQWSTTSNVTWNRFLCSIKHVIDLKPPKSIPSIEVLLNHHIENP